MSADYGPGRKTFCDVSMNRLGVFTDRSARYVARGMPGKVDGHGSSGPSQVLERPTPEGAVPPRAVDKDHIAGRLSFNEVEHYANAT
jgi:hypothetical protein